jgi:iron complex outermembrane receptor protein
VAIAKPVIRGMYGNRVLVLLSSLKFDNQQWQDEHGMGLSDVGVDRVELIKGPASILYGSDAVGGVVNVIEEQPVGPGLKSDLNLRLSSNTGGINADAGWSKANDQGWWRIRIGAENHADYSDGAGTRVLNSRFNGYYWKGTLARQNARSKHVYNYNGSLNNFGFILPDLISQLVADARWSRSMSAPHHVVAINAFSAQNTYWREHSTLKFNVGLQSNLRLEDEGGGSISLNMHLVSVPYNLQWIKPLSNWSEFIVSNIGSFENNTNYGSRIIIPNANMFEEGISAFLKQNLKEYMKTKRRFMIPGKELIFEEGIGVNDKFIQTFLTRALNSPDKEIHPFTTNRTAFNFLAGITWNINDHWNIKLNASSGYRAPNLAELSSNGLHEGIFRYEIGRPDLKAERNTNTEVEINYTSRVLQVRFANFSNDFKNYIYLSPTGQKYFGFPIDRYQQSDATLTGNELTATITPISGWSLTEELSQLEGYRRTGGSPRLPYIAPPKWVNRLRWEGQGNAKFQKPYVFVSGEYVLAQTHPAEYETYTPPYFLLNAGVGSGMNWGHHPVTIRLVGNNLLDRKYADHLSRFKSYGLNNIGRNIMLSIHYNFHA